MIFALSVLLTLTVGIQALAVETAVQTDFAITGSRDTGSRYGENEHHDGTLETINRPDFAILQEGGVNYVSFVVTGFSTFAFAQTSVAIREKNGTVTAKTDLGDTTLFLAFYDGYGKMLVCKSGTNAVSAALPDGAVNAKAFVIATDEIGMPLLAPVVWVR